MNAAEMEDFIEDTYVDVFDIVYGAVGRSEAYLDSVAVFARIRDGATAALHRREALQDPSLAPNEADRTLEAATQELSRALEEIRLQRGQR